MNPMAAELCKVSLWIEALDPGRPLSFLDQRIQVGNSLLGATPALLRAGIPDDAFKPIEGDDRKVCSEYRKYNKKERETEQRRFVDQYDRPWWRRLGDLATSVRNLDDISDESIEGVREKEKLYEDFVRSSGYMFGQFWADAWCAAFVWKKTKDGLAPITEDLFREIEKNPNVAPATVKKEVGRLQEQYQFFHWHLAFPGVFRIPPDAGTLENQKAGWNGGFDIVLGNPPWERIKLQEKEYFATRRPDIAGAPNAAARSRLIAALAQEDPTLLAAFLDDRRRAEGESHFVRDSARYPLSGRGDVNTYAIFAETNRLIMGPSGRVGCIVPSGIATDDAG
jgi:hypothetical protein